MHTTYNTSTFAIALPWSSVLLSHKNHSFVFVLSLLFYSFTSLDISFCFSTPFLPVGALFSPFSNLYPQCVTNTFLRSGRNCKLMRLALAIIPKQMNLSPMKTELTTIENIYAKFIPSNSYTSAMVLQFLVKIALAYFYCCCKGGGVVSSTRRHCGVRRNTFFLFEKTTAPLNPAPPCCVCMVSPIYFYVPFHGL